MIQGDRHSSCQHKHYRLTCADYDALVTRTNNRCQICETPAINTWRRKLVIDHDHDLGVWAVRGLLCPRCNTRLGRGETTEREAQYLASPWYRHNVTPLRLAEPQDGTHVHDGTTGVWQRKGDLWHPQRGYYRDPQSWVWLLRMFGPHRLRTHK